MVVHDTGGLCSVDSPFGSAHGRLGRLSPGELF